MIHYVTGPFRTEKMKLKVRSEVAGDVAELPFEKEIVWNRTSESSIEYWHGGKLLKEGATYNDYYGFMTSQKIAAEDAVKLAKAYGVTEESSLSIVVRTKVWDVPYFRSRRCEPTDLNDSKIRHQLESVFDSRWKTEDDRFLESVELSSEVTWTSNS